MQVHLNVAAKFGLGTLPEPLLVAGVPLVHTFQLPYIFKPVMIYTREGVDEELQAPHFPFSTNGRIQNDAIMAFNRSATNTSSISHQQVPRTI